MAFLKKLRQQNPYRKMALFMDRLAVHRTKLVTETAAALKFRLIYNASYSPNFNPIEGVIGLAKAYVKQQRWKNLRMNVKVEDNVLINEAFKKVKLS